MDYTSVGRAGANNGWGSNQRSARAEAVGRGGGTTSVTRNQVPRLLGRSWTQVGESATPKTSMRAAGQREKYPAFLLCLFCSLPLSLPLVDPSKKPVDKRGWEVGRK